MACSRVEYDSLIVSENLAWTQVASKIKAQVANLVQEPVLELVQELAQFA